MTDQIFFTLEVKMFNYPKKKEKLIYHDNQSKVSHDGQLKWDIKSDSALHLLTLITMTLCFTQYNLPE